ncbi:MAG: Eco57I restriction-modification methylase domain-containing protein [Promethearchaeota archaeon]
MGAFLIYATAFVSLQNFKNINFSFWGFEYDPYIIEICKYLVKLLKFHPKFGKMFQNISFLHTDSLESLEENKWRELLTKNSKNIIKIPPNFNEEIVDIIITNPPYKSWGLGRVGTLQSDLAEKYRDRFSTAEYKISFYALFIERAIQFLKPGGWGAFVLPDSFLMGKYYQKLRNFLLSKSILLEISLFESNFWSQANSGLPVILILQKNSIDTSKIEGSMRSIRCILKNNEVSILHEYKMDPKIFNNQSKNRFRLHFSQETENFTTEFKKNSIPFKKYFEIHHGIRSRTGVGKDRITSRMKKNHYWKRGLISGNSVVPYLIHYQGHFIMIKPEMLFSGGFNASQIEQEKIILRRTGDRLIAAVDTDGFYHSNTLLYLIPKKDVVSPISLYALCTILNSAIFNRYYQLITLKEGRTLPQVEIDTLDELPLKIDESILQQLDGVGRILHRIRRTSQIRPLNEEDQKDIDELILLAEKTIENLYLE